MWQTRWRHICRQPSRCPIEAERQEIFANAKTRLQKEKFLGGQKNPNSKKKIAETITK
jgi:hypothetical protein